jgi:acyl transferase domain-containing protein
MACRFPGATSADELWEILRNGEDKTRSVPTSRYDARSLHADEPTPGKLRSQRGAFIDDIDQFDAEFFDVSDEDACWLDPQQRLLLMTAYEALEDAGLVLDRIAGTRAGVYVGHMHSNYSERLHRKGLEHLSPSLVANYRSLLSGRLSYAFDLRGPSVSLDTACSSSLVGLHLACQSLRSGESPFALVCGTNLKLLPDEDVLFSQFKMIAPDGRSKFGDASANGFCPADGVDVIVLKPLAQAVADGDNIRAIVRGSAVSNDGASSGRLLRPSIDGQVQTLRWAYEDAEVSPSDVDYVEAHGTGTPVIDPIEFAAFGEVFNPGRANERPLLVGSVKTNIGHSEGAAGLAGVMKAVLTLEHRQVPASLHFNEPNPKVDWQHLAVSVPTSLRNLPRSERPLVAGVSGQGLSAVNVHVVLQEFPRSERDESQPDVAKLFVMSARTTAALRELAQRYLAHLRPGGKGAAFAIRDICASSVLRRQHHSERFASIVTDRMSLIESLQTFLDAPAPYPDAIEAKALDEHATRLFELRRNYLAGAGTVEFQNSTGTLDVRFVPLPTYPWQTRSYWLDEATS